MYHVYIYIYGERDILARYSANLRCSDCGFYLGKGAGVLSSEGESEEEGRGSQEGGWETNKCSIGAH